MKETIEYNNLEGWIKSNHITDPIVTVSFQTRQHGYFQIECLESGVREIDSEPDLYLFTDEEREYIEAIAMLVWRMVHDTPAMKERFESKELSSNTINR